MAVFEKHKLLAQLTTDVATIVAQIQALPNDEALLNRHPDFQKWSAAQILAHLNFYNNFYLPHLEKRLMGNNSDQRIYKPGWLGNYFTKVMQPGVNGEIANKMSAPIDARPSEQLNASAVVQEFLTGEKKLLQLLAKAEQSNLNARIQTSISKLIKMKAGDTFRFLIAHQQRHMLQLKRTLEL